VQAGAGIEIHAKPGDLVVKDQTILTLHTDESNRFDRAVEVLTGSFSIGGKDEVVQRLPLVIERIEG
jgi:thymidine phosphorylase